MDENYGFELNDANVDLFEILVNKSANAILTQAHIRKLFLEVSKYNELKKLHNTMKNVLLTTGLTALAGAIASTFLEDRHPVLLCYGSVSACVTALVAKHLHLSNNEKMYQILDGKLSPELQERFGKVLDEEGQNFDDTGKEVMFGSVICHLIEDKNFVRQVKKVESNMQNSGEMQ